ncbi:MAG: bifunctional [glutamate--ammonia ligase]-adenylyl-L-tyrosine phosphorylase/[glutamate--ammonia-ligase] adenylyltransferase [Gammaproteobacteria bacterium]|nr:bifunctional [glutamate--ammonia ligase]-adenylyl-L-tyrosine phosphorylase/[glutamate--ammonia-ligase] adenylyltransferase [Gammaproteobacteria bacterium]
MSLTIPSELQTRIEKIREELSPEFIHACRQSSLVSESLERVLACSEFISQTCQRQPQQIIDLLQCGDLFEPYSAEQMTQALSEILLSVEDENALHQRLRLFRRREMVRIAWRDIAGWAELNETLQDLSALADACVDLSLEKLHQWQCHDIGTPCNEAGEAQQMVVLGMGKLGAYELNYSSDIDLIYCFPEPGETRDGPRSMSNEQFFTRLAQRLTQAINNQTVDGFVFRVDLRLRPFGDSGPQAMSFAGMENYYTSHGREWERYAMVKARVIAGDQPAGKELMAMLRPFVYRRYLDYGAFENLREMKEMITQEVKRKGMQDNVKLGPGGIREVEFIGQAFQLIRGGQDKALQERRIRQVLALLQERDLLPAYVVEELDRCYVFLRDTEHRLQQWRDEQTQMVPTDEEGQIRLAYAMGFDSWQEFRSELDGVMSRVHGHFMQVFAAPQAEAGEHDDSGNELLALWQGVQDQDESLHILMKLGFPAAEDALRQVTSLRNSRVYSQLSKNGKSRMDRLMPLLISAIGISEQPMQTLSRILGLLDKIARRTAYLALLVENPMALSQLVHLCSASPWITQQLSQFPMLLDELLDPRTLYVPPTRDELEAELRRRMAKVDREDLENQMEVLRHFHHANMLRVAAADVVEAIPLMVVSDHLTHLAEVVLGEVLDLAWWHLISRHGRPICSSDGAACEQGFAIVAYGKLGGLELGYGSDLDIIFLHGSESEDQLTSGEKPIPNAVFFARLAQRIIHMLTALTPSGQLYEVDTRLRPSGASGLMVSSLEAFEQYEMEKAWTWEHQALVRARVVAGDMLIANAFEKIRKKVLCLPREESMLKREVSEMREKMRISLGSKENAGFDIKQDRGGIADIEFITQYAVLVWAQKHPDLSEYTDNMRILDSLNKEGLLSAEEVTQLQQAYKSYRQLVHRMKLQEQKPQISERIFATERENVSRIWQEIFSSK